MTIALAIFAKTPELSAVKTRLAADIGEKLALEFYELSVNCICQMAQEAADNCGVTPYWALAEQQAVGLDRWAQFENIWTGEGGLGQRLHNIYSQLSQKHDGVIIIGTDSPQLDLDVILTAIAQMKKHSDSAIIGPCPDGGFYLFAAKMPIKKEVWTSVEYSKNATLFELKNKLKQMKVNSIMLDQQTDVDIKGDLRILFKTLKYINNNELKKLEFWLGSMLS